MSAGEYCTREVIITDAPTPVAEAARLMRQHHVGDLVVTERRGEVNVPVGIITDRDLVVEVLAQDVDPVSITVGDIMSRDLLKVEETDTLLDSLEKMQKRGVRRALVTGEKDALVGVLSIDDAMEIIAEASGHMAALIRHELGYEQRHRV